VPALEGREDPGRAILVETGWERALRTRESKVLVRRKGGETTLEYYDLAADPGERSNLAASCEGPCREGVRRLSELERGLVARPGSSTQPGGVTPDEIEELRALGYLND
jgi:hypothetical protein